MNGFDYQDPYAAQIQAGIRQQLGQNAARRDPFSPEALGVGQAPMQAPRQGLGQRMTGLLGQIGGGIRNYLADDENRARLAMGFNTMRLTPDQGLASALQSRIETAQAMKLLDVQANRTADALEQMGFPAEADAVRNNPTMAKEILQEVMKKRLGTGGVAIKTSEVMTDPQSGQQYVVKTDPNTGEVTRVNVEGALGQTPQQKAELERQNAIILADREQAQNVGFAAFQRAEQLGESIGRLYSAYNAIDEGAGSGYFRSMLPALDAATAQLRTTASQLGIDVINSATFGALSESELRLALSTELDLSLPESELRKQVEARIRAKDMLRSELLKAARTLTSGNTTYSDFIRQYEVVPMAPPPGVPIGLWGQMTNQEKQEFIRAGGQ